jgi:hypothetical protein
MQCKCILWLYTVVIVIHIGVTNGGMKMSNYDRAHDDFELALGACTSYNNYFTQKAFDEAIAMGKRFAAVVMAFPASERAAEIETLVEIAWDAGDLQFSEHLSEVAIAEYAFVQEVALDRIAQASTGAVS